MSHRTHSNILQQPQEEKEHTYTQMVHYSKRKTENLAASYNCHYHLFTETEHKTMPCELQAEEWWLLAGVLYGLGNDRSKEEIKK